MKLIQFQIHPFRIWKWKLLATTSFRWKATAAIHHFETKITKEADANFLKVNLHNNKTLVVLIQIIKTVTQCRLSLIKIALSRNQLYRL